MTPPSGSSAICFSHETRSFRSFSSSAVFGSSGRSGLVAPSRCISTADGNGSTSAKNAGVHPKCRQARLAASTPLQILPYFMFAPVQNVFSLSGNRETLSPHLPYHRLGSLLPPFNLKNRPVFQGGNSPFPPIFAESVRFVCGKIVSSPSISPTWVTFAAI